MGDGGMRHEDEPVTLAVTVSTRRTLTPAIFAFIVRHRSICS